MTMRPLHLAFAPADVNAAGFATGLTDTGPWATADFTRSAATDSLAHLPTLTSAANLSAINITVTGTDPDGVAVTETLAGPNTNTVTLTKYFATITAVSAASTLGANTLDVGWAGSFVSQTLPTEIYFHGGHYTAGFGVTGTIAFDLECTTSNLRAESQALQSSYLWLNDANFASKSASLISNTATAPYTAVRVIANSYSNGAALTFDLLTSQ